MKLSDITRKIARKDIEVAGVKVVVHVLSAAGTAAIREMLPRPVPPPKPDGKGGVEPDFGDAGYLRESASYQNRFAMVEALAGLAWETACGKTFSWFQSPAANTEWMVLAEKESKAVLTDAEFAAVVKVQDELGGELIRGAAKN